MIKEFADWFKDETGIDDFYLGLYTDGEAFIETGGYELPFRVAIKFMKNRQQKLF